MANSILDSKLNILKLNSRLNKLKKVTTISKFSGKIRLKSISKFSDFNEIKSELDMKIPMEVELSILKTGQTKDGMIERSDLEESLPLWESLPIIDFHDMSDMTKPTSFKMSDLKGRLKGEPRVEVIDNEEWIINDALITDRYMAYLIYISEKQDKPLEISAEFARRPMFKGSSTVLTHIKPHIISIVDQGEIKGNKIKIKAPI